MRFQVGINLCPGEVGCGRTSRCAFFAHHNGAGVGGGAVVQLVCGTPAGGANAQRLGGSILRYGLGQYVATPVGGVETGGVQHRAGRHRTRGRCRARNAARLSGRAAENAFKGAQHTACIALQVIREGVAARLLPYRVVVDIGGRGLAHEGVALGVVGLAPPVGWVGFEATVFGRHDKLVAGAAPRGVSAPATILINVEEECFYAQAGTSLCRVRPFGPADVFDVGPVSRSNDLACLRFRGHAVVGCVGVGNGLGDSLAVHISAARIALKTVGDASPITNVGDIVRRASGGKSSTVMGLGVAHHDNIAFHAGIVGSVGAATTIRVIWPAVIGREAISHVRGDVADCRGARLQALQVSQCFVMQLAHRVIYLIAALNRARAAELVEGVDHTADAHGVSVWVCGEHSGGCIPFCCGVAASRGVVGAVDVVSLGADIFHGRAQHAAVTARVVALGLVHEVAKCGQAQLVAIFLDHADGFVFAAGVLLAQPIVPHILQYAADICVAYPHAGIKKTVGVERAWGRGWGRPAAGVRPCVAHFCCSSYGLAKYGVGAGGTFADGRHFPGIVYAIPNFANA